MIEKNKYTVDTDTPVLVTGATGYVAGVLIKQLVEAGVTVHGTVRSLKDQDRLAYIYRLAKGTSGSIKLFEADLMEEGSFEEAMANCGTVFHVASPFHRSAKNPFRDLLQPALVGTKNVLHQACFTPSVRRVVLTSSSMALYTDASDCAKAPHQRINEDCWNSTASMTHNPYALSKTLAEKAAWEIADTQSQWTLVTINPSLVTGPGVKYHASSESFKLFRALAGGEMKAGAPKLAVSMVDVRDVAEAHIAAAYTPTASGRFLVTAYDTDLMTMATVLRHYYPDYPVPAATIPKALVWVAAPYLKQGFTRKIIANNVNVPVRLENWKSKKELGIEYRPMKDTLYDMFHQMIDAQAVKRE